MNRTALVASLSLALLTGCSVLQGPSSAPDAEAARDTEIKSQTQPEPASIAPQMLAFADRLAVADADTLNEMGDGLRSAARDGASVQAQLRLAYWQATPGHPGFAPERARRALDEMLSDANDQIDGTTRALLRLQLRHLRRALAWRQRNAELSRDNEQLRDKIRELTDLERRMESDR